MRLPPPALTLFPYTTLFRSFSSGEVRLLTYFMEMYKAAPGVEIIREGEAGDFMLMLVEGKVDVLKRYKKGMPQQIATVRSEEHTSELQSQFHLVCRLLLEKK